MIKGKKYLEESFPESILNIFHGQTTMNSVRYDKRREERRKKLADILLLFYRADVKIFPEEKQLLKNTYVNSDADPTDNTDEQRLEFYTSVEFKKTVTDYVKGLGSRSLGVLIAYGELYIVYLTYDGNLLWRKDTEIEFYNNTKNVLARKLFGKNNGTYLLVISDDKMVPSIIMKGRCVFSVI